MVGSREAERRLPVVLLLLATVPHFATGRFSGGAPMHIPGTGVELGRLYEKTGMVRDSPGKSCGELLSMGMTGMLRLYEERRACRSHCLVLFLRSLLLPMVSMGCVSCFVIGPLCVCVCVLVCVCVCG